MARTDKPVKGSEDWWQHLVGKREPRMRDWQRRNYQAILDAAGVEADALSGRARALVLWLSEYDDAVVESAVELLTAVRNAGWPEPLWRGPTHAVYDDGADDVLVGVSAVTLWDVPAGTRVVILPAGPGERPEGGAGGEAR